MLAAKSLFVAILIAWVTTPPGKPLWATLGAIGAYIVLFFYIYVERQRSARRAGARRSASYGGPKIL
jgi:hypothetical protein